MSPTPQATSARQLRVQRVILAVGKHSTTGRNEGAVADNSRTEAQVTSLGGTSWTPSAALPWRWVELAAHAGGRLDALFLDEAAARSTATLSIQR